MKRLARNMAYGIVAFFIAMALVGFAMKKESPQPSPQDVKLQKAAQEITLFGERMRQSLCNEPLTPIQEIPGVSVEPEEKIEC